MYAFGVFQNGVMVVSVYGENLEQVKAEIAHYAKVYAQDCPVEVLKIDPDDQDWTGNGTRKANS